MSIYLHTYLLSFYIYTSIYHPSIYQTLSLLDVLGNKEQVYEGGIRGVGFVHSPLLKKKGVVSNRQSPIYQYLSICACIYVSIY